MAALDGFTVFAQCKAQVPLPPPQAYWLVAALYLALPSAPVIASAWLPPASTRSVEVWAATNSSKTLLRLRAHSNVVGGLAFSANGQRLATAGADRTVKLWNLTTDQPVLTFREDSQCVAFSPDGFRLACANLDGTIRIWDARPLASKGGQGLLTLEHPNQVWVLAVCRDGRQFAAGGPPRDELEKEPARANPAGRNRPGAPHLSNPQNFYL